MVRSENSASSGSAFSQPQRLGLVYPGGDFYAPGGKLRINLCVILSCPMESDFLF